MPKPKTYLKKTSSGWKRLMPTLKKEHHVEYEPIKDGIVIPIEKKGGSIFDNLPPAFQNLNITEPITTTVPFPIIRDHAAPVNKFNPVSKEDVCNILGARMSGKGIKPLKRM